MTTDQGSLGECGLYFFGAITASVSHELKNALGVIHENAMLLDDMAAMGEKNLLLDPARISGAAADIGRQIRRVDGILKNLNRFAHSTDDIFNSVDLGEILALMVSLCARFAAMKGITIDYIPPAKPLFITTRLFYLENLIWLLLKDVIKGAGTAKILTLTLKPQISGAALIFSPAAAPPSDAAVPLILTVLNAALFFIPEKREIRITLPEK